MMKGISVYSFTFLAMLAGATGLAQAQPPGPARRPLPPGDGLCSGNFRIAANRDNGGNMTLTRLAPFPHEGGMANVQVDLRFDGDGLDTRYGTCHIAPGGGVSTLKFSRNNSDGYQPFETNIVLNEHGQKVFVNGVWTLRGQRYSFTGYSTDAPVPTDPIDPACVGTFTIRTQNSDSPLLVSALVLTADPRRGAHAIGGTAFGDPVTGTCAVDPQQGGRRIRFTRVSFDRSGRVEQQYQGTIDASSGRRVQMLGTFSQNGYVQGFSAER